MACRTSQIEGVERREEGVMVKAESKYSLPLDFIFFLLLFQVRGNQLYR